MSKKTASYMFMGAWILLFAIVLIAYNSYKSRRLSIVSSGPGTLVLRSDSTHHYRFKGYINDTKVAFLIDTGATMVAIPKSIALKLGLKKMARVVMSTANGKVTGYLTRIRQLRMGEIVLTNIKAVIIPNFHQDNVLLGMSALKQLEFTQQGNILTIKTRP